MSAAGVFLEAGLSDLACLGRLMSEFNLESGYPAMLRAPGSWLEQFLAEQRLGRAWLIQIEQEIVGYLILCHGFSFEHGGLEVFIDELYVRPPQRRRGLGKAALEFAQQYCLENGIKAMQLEVENHNPAAHALYVQAGFRLASRSQLSWKPA